MQDSLYAFIPVRGLIWSEALKLKSQPMSTCQSIVCSYGKLSRLGTDKTEPIWSGLFKEGRAWTAIRNHLLLTMTFKCYLDSEQSHTGWCNICLVNLFTITTHFDFIFESFIQSKLVKWLSVGTQKRTVECLVRTLHRTKRWHNGSRMQSGRSEFPRVYCKEIHYERF